jgi:23S rRNA (adenine2503-C2)-methyltransferase
MINDPITPVQSFYLPSGRVIVSKTHDGHYIESTEMRDVSVQGKTHAEVRETLDPKVIWKHLVPVTDKWLLTVSTQVGCTYKCKFCDVAPLGFKRNLTREEIIGQIDMLVDSTPEIRAGGTTKAKIGFARMGEPSQNLTAVLDAMLHAKHHIGDNIDWLPCFNTILPSKVLVESRIDGSIHPFTGLQALEEVIDLKEGHFDGYMHIQISANSTDEQKRKELFNGADVTSLQEIIDYVYKTHITNRTVTLNFICMEGIEVDPRKLENLDPSKFAVKLIPLNNTDNAAKNALSTDFNYRNLERMEELEQMFRKLGVPTVTDAVCKAEETGLCCGQLVSAYWK